MKRVNTVSRWCVLFAGAALAVGACVEEGPKAPPLLGQLGPVMPRPMDAGMAGASGAAGSAGSAGSGGTAGSAGNGGAAGSTPVPEAGAPDAADGG